MSNIETENRDTWTAYGARQLTRASSCPSWTGGPGTSRGPAQASRFAATLEGLSVLDLGSGLGLHAACVTALGARITAVDSSPTQHQRAAARYPDVPGLRLVCAGAVDHLRGAEPYELIYSVSGVPFTDPRRLLPALANGLKPGRRFLFTALHSQLPR